MFAICKDLKRTFSQKNIYMTDTYEQLTKQMHDIDIKTGHGSWTKYFLVPFWSTIFPPHTCLLRKE